MKVITYILVEIDKLAIKFISKCRQVDKLRKGMYWEAVLQTNHSGSSDEPDNDFCLYRS